jgi:hypothetical protein
MSDEQNIKIARDELFTESVSDELARIRTRSGGRPPEPPPVSRLRRIVYSSMFYLPAAGLLAALLVWGLLEPHIHDQSVVAGDVVLVNEDPFTFEGMRSVTIGATEAIVGDATLLVPGLDGQPAYASVDEIAPGDTVEAIGFAVDEVNAVMVMALRPTTDARAHDIETVRNTDDTWAISLLFPVTATLIAVFLLIAEGISTRNWNRMLVRTGIGALLTMVFSGLAMIPAGILMTLGQNFLTPMDPDQLFITIDSISPANFFLFTMFRSLAWACVGAGLGLGMNLARATPTQLRNSVLGGTLGGAVGGLFFDPIDRFLRFDSHFDGDGDLPRLVGLIAIGICIGVFVALVERLASVAWIRVRTGPLAGKAFVLYRTPTRVGSSSSADIYLFKDAEIDPEHALIHRVGRYFEIEDQGSRTGIEVNDRAVRRRRLVSGDQIEIGSTVLEFEERAKRTQTA